MRNPDFDDNGKTSLHLAAELGLPDVAIFLLEQGHEDAGISRTISDGLTPLMLACAAGSDEESNVTVRGRIEVGRMLVEKYSKYVGIRDKAGLDAFQHAAKHGTNALLVLFLSRDAPHMPQYDEIDEDAPIPPRGSSHPLLYSRDALWNTPLHHASAFGHLKTLRLLMSAGADDTARNKYSWTPVDYSASVAAEVYLKGLIRERDQVLHKGNPNARLRGASDEKARVTRSGIRMVKGDGSSSDEDNSEENGAGRPRGRART